jgi:hypothetical protein
MAGMGVKGGVLGVWRRGRAENINLKRKLNLFYGMEYIILLILKMAVR